MNRTTFLFFLLLGSLMYACSDILEEDLRDDTIIILVPGDNLTTDLATVSFDWEPLDGAIQYNLRIVSSSFEAIQSIALDSTISTDQFAWTLSPGIYQWRILASNNSTELSSDTFDLIIEEASSLEGQIVNLGNPINGGFITNDATVFQWQVLPLADQYQIQVGSPNLSNSLNIVLDDLTTDDFFQAELGEGAYEWQVKAINTNSESPFSIGNFNVDFTPPNAPALISPSDNAILTNDVAQLSWSFDADAVADNLYIYTDSLQTLLSGFPQLITSEPPFSFQGSINTKYFWRMTSVDEAGNESEFSLARSFTIGQ